VKPLGKVRDRSVCTSQLLQNAASRDVREGGERGIETGPRILNHAVQYITQGLAACKRRPTPRCETTSRRPAKIGGWLATDRQAASVRRRPARPPPSLGRRISRVAGVRDLPPTLGQSCKTRRDRGSRVAIAFVAYARAGRRPGSVVSPVRRRSHSAAKVRCAPAQRGSASAATNRRMAQELLTVPTGDDTWAGEIEFGR